MRKFEIYYRDGGRDNPSAVAPMEYRIVVKGDRVDLHPEDSRRLAVFTDRGDRHEITALFADWVSVTEVDGKEAK